jgi:hypothetical protein
LTNKITPPLGEIIKENSKYLNSDEKERFISDYLLRQHSIVYWSTMRCKKCHRHLVMYYDELYCYDEFTWMPEASKKFLDSLFLDLSVDVKPEEIEKIKEKLLPAGESDV